MPAIEELAQLFGATQYLENGWGIYKGGFFWSSSDAATGFAWRVYFWDGLRNAVSRSTQYAVRLVRVGQ